MRGQAPAPPPGRRAITASPARRSPWARAADILIESLRLSVKREVLLLGYPLKTVLHVDVVPGVDADLVAALQSAAYNGGIGGNYQRRGQQRTVHERLEAVGGGGLGAHHLGDEARTEDAPYRLAGVVGAEGEEDAGPYALPFEQSEHARHTLKVAAQRVDIDLNGESRHYLASFSAYQAIVL